MMLPLLMATQRIAWYREVSVLGQHDVKLALRHRHHAASGAMYEGYRRAPVTLARNAPVAQAPHGRAFAPALMLGARDDGGFRLVDRHAVEEVAVHEDRKSVV